MRVMEKDIKLEIYKRGVFFVDDEAVYGFIDEFSMGYRRIDLIGVNHDLKKIYIIEIKSKTINSEAVNQLAEYITIIEPMIKASNKISDYEVCGILIAPNICAQFLIKVLMPKIRFLQFQPDGTLLKKNYNLSQEFISSRQRRTIVLEDHLNLLGKELPFAEVK